MEKLIPRHVLQVFTGGQDKLKRFIKARNSPLLEKAIQDAREEE